MGAPKIKPYLNRRARQESRNRRELIQLASRIKDAHQLFFYIAQVRPHLRKAVLESLRPHLRFKIDDAQCSIDETDPD